MTRLAICAIFRDEAPYLAEWVAFHRAVGVERFFLYDDRSSDDPYSVLKPWIDEGSVVVHPWPVDVGQLPAYAHCIQNYGAAVQRIAFIDVDEFLFSPLGQDVRDVLDAFNGAPGIAVNWVTFGSGGHSVKPEGGVLDSYLLRGELDAVVPYPHLKRPDGSFWPLNAHIKSVVDPRAVAALGSPHHFGYHGGRLAIDTCRRPVAGPFTQDVSADVLRVHHYWSKSVEECRAKFARGRADTTTHRAWEEFERRDAVLNDVRDETILARLALARP